MPPQTPKEAIRETALASIQEGVSALKNQTRPSPMTSGPDFSSIYHIPGASMHEILYTNGDGASEPDRVVVPKQACGELTSKELASESHSGTVPANPLHARMDNYGNRWLEGGFEYPPYEGRLTTSGGTSDDIGMSHATGTNGDEPSNVRVESEQNGAPTVRKASDKWPGMGSAGGDHTGQRSDKWPSIGLTDFKPGQSA